LIAKGGSHWGSYGALLAADSMLKFVSAKIGKELPVILIDSIPYGKEPRNGDDDITRTMNLIWNVRFDSMPYPVFHVKRTDNTFTPRVLFIADSFYKIWDAMGIIDSVFANNDFWFYHEEVYPFRDKQHANAWNLSLQKEIASQDVIVIMNTSGGSPNLGYGFIERLYAEMCPGPDRVRDYLKLMYENTAWREAVSKKAEQKGFTFEGMAMRDAIYMSNREMERGKRGK
jgi:hypothetical protein